MELKERSYNVLQISAVEKFNAVLAPFLSGSKYASLKTVNNCAAAKRIVTQRPFDIVIINSPLPDENGTKLAVDIAHSGSTVVLLFVRGEIYDQLLPEMTGQGVYMLPKPTSAQMIRQALDWIAVTRERLRGMEKKTLSLSEKMDEIRLVNRAKWLLITKQSMTEEEAHHFIEKQAMNRCVTRRFIAEEIIGNEQ